MKTDCNPSEISIEVSKWFFFCLSFFFLRVFSIILFWVSGPNRPSVETPPEDQCTLYYYYYYFFLIFVFVHFLTSKRKKTEKKNNKRGGLYRQGVHSKVAVL